MKIIPHLTALVPALVLLAGCASRSEYVPEGGTTTVGMPAELSDRERMFIGEVDAALRGEGYLPVRHGAGELQLEFRISEGPVNTDTTLELRDGRTVLAEGRSRGSGVPMIGRDRVAERSFQQAFGNFQAALPGAGQARFSGSGSGGDGGEMEYVY
jgi:hypothetical protein